MPDTTPRQNRVTPFSTIIATRARGQFMGNRGCLHDPSGRIVRPWRGTLWITCLTEFRRRRRPLMQPGRYTELFFLDEAVALAAGHRPCVECRRADYHRFRAAWGDAGLPSAPRAGNLDRHLHAARLGAFAARPEWPLQDIATLPDGCFITRDGAALLVRQDRLMPWHPGGYGPALPRPATGLAACLTPAPMIDVLAAGYRPALHPDAVG